jgi:universal stress protein A
MKVRPEASGGVAFELSPKETALPQPRSPFRIKKLLVPVDFSSCSAKAVRYAVELAGQFDSDIVLMHAAQVYLPSSDMMVTIDTEAVCRDIRENAMKDLMSMREQIDADIKCHTMVTSGRAYSEIVQAAKDLDVDMIVMSTHGRTGLSHTFLGSTTERVVRHAPCPVLVVREREHDFLSAEAEPFHRQRT